MLDQLLHALKQYAAAALGSAVPQLPKLTDEAISLGEGFVYNAFDVPQNIREAISAGTGAIETTVDQLEVAGAQLLIKRLSGDPIA